MYAVIETGGKQYRVSEGDVITIEKIKGDPNTSVDFDKVLLIGGTDDTAVGTPYLEAAKVFGTIVESGKGKKVIIFKYKAKKDYRKKQGHRQPYTAVQIDKISADGKAPEKKAVLAKTEEPAAEKVALEADTAATPVAEKKPAVKKTAAKKTTADKSETEKKATTKKTTAKKAEEPKPEQE